MKNHRFAVTGLAVLAAASLALAGCSASSKTSDNPSASSSPSTAAADPNTMITTAFTGLTTTGFDFTETQGPADGDHLNGTGTIDPTKKSASLVAKGTTHGINVELDVVEVSPNVWAKLDLGALNATLGLPNTWMSLDPSKITANSLPIDFTSADLLDLSGLFTSVTNLTMADATTITGTVDLTKATGSTAPDVSQYAAQAAATPFTVKFDGSGHPVSLTIDTSAYDKDSELAFTFSNFGSPSAVTAPTGATPAPDSVYSFLSSSGS